MTERYSVVELATNPIDSKMLELDLGGVALIGVDYTPHPEDRLHTHLPGIDGIAGAAITSFRGVVISDNPEIVARARGLLNGILGDIFAVTPR